MKNRPFQMYNLKQDIQEIDLQAIKNFTAYSQIISNANSRKQNYLTVKDVGFSSN